MTGLITNELMLLKCSSSHDVSSVTVLGHTVLRLPANHCSGGKTTAHLKVMAHVRPNLL
jgi:hypothetical protein